MSFDRFADRYTDILDNSVAFSGDGSDYFASIKARYLANLLGATSSFAGKILDFGCGIGLVSTQLAALLPRATLCGFDPSTESLARVPEATRARGAFVDDAKALDADFDVAFVANVLHHVPVADRPGAVSLLASRLRPGGKLVVFEHNPLNVATRVVVATCALDHDAVLLPRRETERHLRNAGLRVARHDYITFFPKLLAPLRPLEKHIGWLPLGAQYAVVGEKT